MRRYDPATGHIVFSLALDILHAGRQVKRSAWENIWVQMDSGGYYMHIAGRQVPWTPTWDDLQAKDWQECFQKS